MNEPIKKSRYCIDHLHVANLIADVAARAALLVVQALARLVRGAAVARPGTRTPGGPGGPVGFQRVRLKQKTRPKDNLARQLDCVTTAKGSRVRKAAATLEKCAAVPEQHSAKFAKV